MRLIIDIPEDDYEFVKEQVDTEYCNNVRQINNRLYQIIANGTVLKQGKWVYTSETIDGTYHCSECGMVKKIKTNFCGRCGADMREPEGET